jgi:hypothetical protein
MNWIDQKFNLQPFLTLTGWWFTLLLLSELWSICTGYDFRICFFVVDTFIEKNKAKMDWILWKSLTSTGIDSRTNFAYYW